MFTNGEAARCPSGCLSRHWQADDPLRGRVSIEVEFNAGQDLGRPGQNAREQIRVFARRHSLILEVEPQAVLLNEMCDVEGPAGGPDPVRVPRVALTQSSLKGEFIFCK